MAKANANETFKTVSKELARLEIAQAKAEISSPQTLPDLLATKQGLLKKRIDVLQTIGISESDLTPQYTCKKCSDTGFLKSGTACDCYKK